MKMLKILALVGLASTATLTMANERIITEDGIATFSTFKPAAVRAEVGTTGYGAALSWSPNPYVGVTLGYNGGNISWSDDLSINGSDYDLEMENNLTYLNAEIRPFANWFYLAAGVGYIDNDYELERRAGTNASFSVDGSRFNAANTDVRLKGALSYKNSIAPYVGVGFSPAITNRIGLFGEIGAYYNGNPAVSLNANEEALGLIGSDGRTLSEAIAAEKDAIRNDNEYEWLPVAKVGLSVRF